MAEWSFFSLSVVALVAMFVCIRGIIVNARTREKRCQLIDRWKTSGDRRLAAWEFDQVDFKNHNKADFWGKDSKALYGPLIQGIWNTDAKQTYSDYWWRSYHQVYMPHSTSIRMPEIRREMAFIGSTYMPTILEMHGFGLPPQDVLPEKFSMADGAEEYDQIMAAQEIMQ